MAILRNFIKHYIKIALSVMKLHEYSFEVRTSCSHTLINFALLHTSSILEGKKNKYKYQHTEMDKQWSLLTLIKILRIQVTSSVSGALTGSISIS
jgi:hypothetical protein